MFAADSRNPIYWRPIHTWLAVGKAVQIDCPIFGGAMADSSYGIRTTDTERHTMLMKRGFSFISPILAGLALAVVIGLFTHNVTIDPRFNEVLIFLGEQPRRSWCCACLCSGNGASRCNG